MSGPYRPEAEYSTIVTVPTPEVARVLGPRGLSQSGRGAVSSPTSPRGDVGPFSQSCPTARPPLTRGTSQIQQAAKFVGLYGDDEEAEPERARWKSKRLQFLSKKYKCNMEELTREARSMDPVVYSDSIGLDPVASDSPHINGPQTGTSTSSHFFGGGASPSLPSGSRHRVEQKESVVRVVYDMASSLIKRGTIHHKKKRVPLTNRSSFDFDGLDASDEPMTGFTSIGAPFATSEIGTAMSDMSKRHVTYRIPEEPSAEVDDTDVASAETEAKAPEARGDDLSRPSNLSRSGRPVLRPGPPPPEIAFSFHSTTTTFEGMPMPPPRHSLMQIGKARSHPIITRASSTLSDEVFFEFDPSNVPTLDVVPESAEDDFMEIAKNRVGFHPDVQPLHALDMGSATLNERLEPVHLGQPRILLDVGRPDKPSPSRGRLEKQPSFEDVEMHKRHIGEDILNRIMANDLLTSAPRTRYRGMGVFGLMFGRNIGRKKVKRLPDDVREKIERGDQERSFFTYWVTFVQIFICILSITSYGIGSWGYDVVERKGDVLDTSLTNRRVAYHEPANFWIGPKFADLIRLGAKYSPCMRRERRLYEQIEIERRAENVTGCCVMTDRSGCYQTGEATCPSSHAVWIKWGRKPKQLKKSKSDSDLLSKFRPKLQPAFHVHESLSSSTGRTAGAVCGQDPEYCVSPSSVDPHQWADDLTKWPRCRETRLEGALPDHMTCQLTGRPCCIQLQGQCRIATQEYCEFVQGHWHENATLCSQVDCFSDVCGMLPFVSRDHPNQIYRLFTSLFLHAGLLHLAVSVVFQMWVMSDFEKMIGWGRMALLYFGSGIGGNLASAIFVPYNPEVGPSGSQLGILAGLLVDLHHHRWIVLEIRTEIGKYCGIVVLLFISGLLPWIDNWAHLFGFIFGLLITIVTFPYLDFPNSNKRYPGCVSYTRRQLAVALAFTTTVLLFGVLSYLFFFNIQFECSFCEYFNCISIFSSDHFCDNNGHRLTKWLPI